MKDLFALLGGDRCSSTFSVRLVFLAASSNSRRATWVGASSIRRGSLFLDGMRMNSIRFTQCLAWPSSFLSYVCQLSPVDHQPLCPDWVNELLTYTHNCMSCSVGYGVAGWCAGLVFAVNHEIVGFGCIVCGGLLGEV